jgi:hypothetical protein
MRVNQLNTMAVGFASQVGFSAHKKGGSKGGANGPTPQQLRVQDEQSLGNLVNHLLLELISDGIGKAKETTGTPAKITAYVMAQTITTPVNGELISGMRLRDMEKRGWIQYTLTEPKGDEARMFQIRITPAGMTVFHGLSRKALQRHGTGPIPVPLSALRTLAQGGVRILAVVPTNPPPKPPEAPGDTKKD